MKKKILQILKLILFVALICFILLKLSDVLMEKSSRNNRMPIYDIQTDVDVLLAGSSHMRDGVYPARLWEKYGITSYCIASSGQRIQMTYYAIKEIMKTKKPKIVVLDLYLASGNEEEGLDMEYGLIHESMDYMPLSRDKIELAGTAAKGLKLSPLAFLSSIYAYHYRWKELKKNDFLKEYNRELGAEALSGIRSHKKPDLKEAVISEDALDGEGYRWISEIMELCRENGSDLLLLNVPYPDLSQDTRNKNYTFMQQAVSEGFGGLDMDEYAEEFGLDYAHDYCDKSHLNVFGAYKVTDFLGQYLIDNENITDHRKDSSYDIWNEYLKAESENRLEKIKDETSAMKTLMTFAFDDNYICSIYTDMSKEAAGDDSLSYTMQKMSVTPRELKDLSDDACKCLESECGVTDPMDEELVIEITDAITGDIRFIKPFKYVAGSYVLDQK